MKTTACVCLAVVGLAALIFILLAPYVWHGA